MIFFWSRRYSILNLTSFLVVGGAITFFGEVALAQTQIVPDNSLGDNNSKVTPISPILDQIDGGATRGANLFHSFQEFNIGDGGSVFFTNPVGIENILTRVTGTNQSNIMGTLGVTGGNANLFLINPNGIFFGMDASLDVRGSFVASTASNLNFADGNQFSATNPQGTVTLTSSVPLGLQFGATAENIRSQGANLTVQPGKTLALVGGDVTLEGGFLSAAGGRVELGSVSGNSLISLNPVSNGWVLGYDGVQNFQDIRLSQGSVVGANEPEGSVTINSGQLTLQDGVQISTTTFGKGDAGDLTIRASESVELQNSSLFARVNSGAEGTGGNLTIETERLTLRDGAIISTSTDGIGQAGNLTIRATESVELRGTGADGSRSGVFAEVNQGAVGNGGNLTIETGELTVRDGSQVSTTTAGVRGDAGDLTIQASSIELIGPTPEIFLISVQGNTIVFGRNPITSRSGLFTRVENGEGTGGDLNIETGKLTIRNGALISATTFATGNAGNINIRASDTVELNDGSGLFAQVISEATGDGGDVTINSGELLVRDNSVINVSSQGQGIAGEISVTAHSIKLEDDGILIAENTSGQGGNITLQVQELLLLRRNSLISTTAGTEGAGGNGGDIIINTDFIIAVPVENSDITANAFNGNGGTIKISVQDVLGIQQQERLTPKSDITASSQLGLSGTVMIDAPNFDIRRGIVEFPEEVINPDELISSSCSVAKRRTASRFVETGRGSLPPNPIDSLGEGATPQSHNIVEAQGWIRVDGQVKLTNQVPMAQPYSSWETPSACFDDTR